VTELLAPVVSITRTQRGRWFWAAWWSGAPTRVPFRKPDASDGGAKSREEALADAQARAGTILTEIDPRWARGWNRVLRGQTPFSPEDVRVLEGAPRPKPRRDRAPRPPREVLGLPKDASPESIKAAFRQRAFETHPDRGGDADAFREVHTAFEQLTRPKKKR
jgi:hypothetical protein